MGLAGTAVAEGEDVFPLGDVLAARQFQYQDLVEGGNRGEVEAIQAFDGGEMGGPNAPLDQPSFSVDEFQLAQA
jgi:hypothetical protein